MNTDPKHEVPTPAHPQSADCSAALVASPTYSIVQRAGMHLADSHLLKPMQKSLWAAERIPGDPENTVVELDSDRSKALMPACLACINLV